MGDLFKFIRNGASIKQGTPGGYPITRIETISDRFVNRDKLGYAGINDITPYKDYILETGDILMSHINSEKHLGKAALYEKEGTEKIIHGMNLLGLRPITQLLLPKFAIYLFQSADFKKSLNKIIKKSVNQASFAVNDLKKIEVSIPSIEDQRKIVDVLDRCQKIIDKRQAQIVAVDVLKQSVFLEIDSKYGEEDKKKIKDIAIINPAKTLIDKEADIEVSFVPMNNVSENGELTLNETKHLKEVYSGFTYFEENDILFAKITPCMENGKGCIAKNLINHIGFGSTEFHIIRSHSSLVTKWIYQVTKSAKFRSSAELNMTGSAGQKRVPKTFIEDYKIKISHESDLAFFNSIFDQSELLKLKFKKALEQDQILYHSLFQKAFKGELFKA